jgi:hypothetical protein
VHGARGKRIKRKSGVREHCTLQLSFSVKGQRSV